MRFQRYSSQRYQPRPSTCRNWSPYSTTNSLALPRSVSSPGSWPDGAADSWTAAVAGVCWAGSAGLGCSDFEVEHLLRCGSGVEAWAVGAAHGRPLRWSGRLAPADRAEVMTARLWRLRCGRAVSAAAVSRSRAWLSVRWPAAIRPPAV